MSQTTSPRLPGVPQLQLHFTGPEYSRWRRSIKFALQAKGTWKYCSGTCPMPMPKAATSPKSISDPQPSLLDERRDWVRHDREAKLDIFLSLSEDVMQEVLEVGPPLPPSNLKAQEMLEALDERFAIFKFEAYHHAFCHFLNIHIDQFPSLGEFNQEFSTTLEDLVDHGHPLSNVQACSAYFSKLRCTQNPWVAKKLEEWDAQTNDMHYTDLLKESPPWSIIRPLTTKSSQVFQVESIPEEHLENSSESDSDTPYESSDASTASSISLHSRHTSNTSLKTAGSQDLQTQRKESVATTQSQEITILASSKDIAEIQHEAERSESERLTAPTVPERGSSKNQVSQSLLTNDPTAPLPEWFASKKSIARPPPPPPLERPLPPLPAHAFEAGNEEPRSAAHSKNSSKASISAPSLSVQLPVLKLETTHPTLRPTTPILPVDVHPALRPTSPAQPITPLTLQTTPNALDLRRPSISSPNLAVPWPSTPDLTARPHSSSAQLPFTQSPNPMPSQVHTPLDSYSPRHSLDDADVDVDDLSLPLQGTRDSAWAYLYEAKGGYLINHNKNTHNKQNPTASSQTPNLPRHSLLTQSLIRIPTYEDTILPSPTPATQHKKASSFDVSANMTSHKKAGSLDFMTRLSGDSLLESSEEVREREREAERKRKKMSWVNVNFARFSTNKGVREII